MMCKASWGFVCARPSAPLAELLLCQIVGRAALRTLSCSCLHLSC